MSEWWCVPATAEHAEAVCSLFERVDCPCYCQYYSFLGGAREWQGRCANERGENQAELVRQLDRGELAAVVALDGERVVGWARIESARRAHKTYEGRVYRGLPCFAGERERIWMVACFLVDPEHRRVGVATRLLSALIERARELGVSALEAFPRGAVDVSDEEQWTGPLPLYEHAGFQRVHDFAPYPVYRLELD